MEQVPLETFDALQANDILFIDSSHAVKFGGDVCREFLEILPRLKPGVWVHVHDIFFPQDYPATWLLDRRLAFNEQYMLEAFLAFNHAFAVRAANFWLALDHRADAETLAPAAVWRMVSLAAAASGCSGSREPFDQCDCADDRAGPLAHHSAGVVSLANPAARRDRHRRRQ